MKFLRLSLLIGVPDDEVNAAAEAVATVDDPREVLNRLLLPGRVIDDLSLTINPEPPVRPEDIRHALPKREEDQYGFPIEWPKHSDGRDRSGVSLRTDLIWYGLCSYWTDDWSKLSDTGEKQGVGKGHGIPCCPICGAVGFEQSATDWWRQVDEYEADGHPGYRAQVMAQKEVCNRVAPRSPQSFYEARRQQMDATGDAD